VLKPRIPPQRRLMVRHVHRVIRPVLHGDKS
jgi:hypothetical protein